MVTLPGVPVEIASTASMFMELKMLLDFRLNKTIMYLINLIEVASYAK